MAIASRNDLDPDDDRPPRPADPLGSFLHGLLTFDTLLAAGGLRVTDSATGVTFLPGCCNGLEDWREWHQVLDGNGQADFGHDPTPTAERHGEIVRLTVDAEQNDSPVIELSATDLRHLLARAEHDLTSFLTLAADWATQNLPHHAVPVTAALARALDLPTPAKTTGLKLHVTHLVNRRTPWPNSPVARCTMCVALFFARLCRLVLAIKANRGWCDPLSDFRFQQDGTTGWDRCESGAVAQHMSSGSVDEAQAVSVHQVAGCCPAVFVSDLTAGDPRVLLPEGFVDIQGCFNNFWLADEPDRSKHLVPGHPLDRGAAFPFADHGVMDPGGLGKDVGASIDLLAPVPVTSLNATRKSGSNEDAYQSDQCTRCARGRNLPRKWHVLPLVGGTRRPASL